MVITNRPNKNLKNDIEKLATQSDQIDIATAFFTESDLIKQWSEKNIDINLLVSLRPPTSFYALKKLQSASNVEISFLGDEFHSKFIIFYKGDYIIGAIIGSSNFTSGGLEKNIETNIFTEETKILKGLEKHFDELIENSNLLQPTDLDNYELLYKNWLKRQKKLNAELKKFKTKITENRTKRNKKPRITKIAKQYFVYWRIVDEIRELVKDIAEKEHPNIPSYLILDHFWHYIKVFWHKETDITLTEKNQKKIIPKLFKDYINWHREFEEDNYPNYMSNLSKNVYQVYLSKKNIDKLTESQARQVFKGLHSSNMPIQRFNADDLFIAENGMSRIRKSLKYLIHSNDEMDLKIHNLIKNPEYKLTRLGTSGVQELNGWTKPKKYPIRNDKADDAIRILGYELN
ncbi:phospholipase D-like domain-containing protein [Winogradskyella poriferorum]|uniref:phospholipase D-like domain-containing protein n=1 Tax=Winogradskyella poriferorum TaxID=307627 RepID=UPI003D6588F4